jgi:hypothetical protein
VRHWRGLIEKDYLGAWDLVDKEGRAREFTLRIAAVDSISLKTREQPKGKRKAVISFERAEKKFVANTTNCETIESLYGPDVDRWVGERVTLYQTDVRNPKGGTIKGIRVRPKKPTGKAEAIAAAPVDEGMRAAQNEAFDRPAREPGED